MDDYKDGEDKEANILTDEHKDIYAKKKQEKPNEAKIRQFTIEQIGDDSINSLGALFRLIELAQNNQLDIFADGNLLRNLQLQFIISTIKITKGAVIKLFDLLSEKDFDGKEDLFDENLISKIINNLNDINSDICVSGECRIIVNLLNTDVLNPYDFIPQFSTIMESVSKRLKLLSPNSEKLNIHAEALFELSKLLLSIYSYFNSLNEPHLTEEELDQKQEFLNEIISTIQNVIIVGFKGSSFIFHSLAAKTTTELVYTIDEEEKIIFDSQLLHRIFELIVVENASANYYYAQYDLLNAARNLTSISDEIIINIIDPEYIISLGNIKYCNSDCLKIALKILYNIACIKTDSFHPAIVSILCKLNKQVTEESYEVKTAFTKLLTCLLSIPDNLYNIFQTCYIEQPTEKFNIIEYISLNLDDNQKLTYSILRSIYCIANYSYKNEGSDISESFEQYLISDNVHQWMCDQTDSDDEKVSILATKLIDYLFSEEEN